MILSDPEVESAVLISSDEGATFEKHPINFHILSLLFHLTQENWILAYSHDSKVAFECNDLIYHAQSASQCGFSMLQYDILMIAHSQHLHPDSIMKIRLILSCSCTVQWTLGGSGSLFTTTWCQDDSTGMIMRLLFFYCFIYLTVICKMTRSRCMSEISGDILSNTNHSHGSCALITSWKNIASFFYSTQKTCCFSSCCCLVISPAWMHGSKYWGGPFFNPRLW